MTGRRRRAAVLLGLSLALGGLAASDVARRQAAVDAQLSPIVAVVVAREDVEAGTRLGVDHLATRRLPARFVPAGAASDPAELLGRRVAVPVPQGGYLAAGQLDVETDAPGAAVARGERAAEVVATGSPALISAGVRVDVLVTRGDGDGEGAGRGATELALEDVEVLAAAPAAQGAAADAESGAPRVAATLRVTLRQAVFLAAAQDFARRVRLLPRAPGDRRRGGRLTVRAGL